MEVIQRPLVFALNGKRVELQHVDPTMTLVTYLRTQTDLKGTKLGCGEGGCGACVVLLSKYDPKTKKVEESTINSCLALLCSVDRCAVTTIEGLGNSRAGLHSIQKRFAGFHASQCGFCTPGMCMSVYGALRKHQGSCSDGNLSSSLHPKRFKAVDLENSVQGNICRCTGYRPISDVCKSFADDVDVEDLGLNTYWSSKEKADRNLLPRYDPKDDPQFPEFIIKELEQEEAVNGLEYPTLVLNSQNIKQQWIRPSSLQEVFSKLENYQGKQQEVKVVVGNTSSGIYKNSNPQVFIDIGHIPDLLVEEQSEHGIEVGAAVRISRLIDILENYSKEENAEDVCQTIAKHLRKVAGSHVRNAASVGGNLIMAQKLGFDSDVATVFLGVGASVKLVSKTMQEIVQSMDEFLENSMVNTTVLKSILIPSFKQKTGAGSTKFVSYRASPRPLGNAVAYVNAAFLVHLSNASEGERRIEESRLAFGAFGERHAVRAIELEKFLRGKVLTHEVILEATHIVRSCVVPRKGTRKASYRSSLAVSFLFKFLESLVQSHTLSNGNIANGNSSSSISVMSGKQELQKPDQGVLRKPLAKVMGELQASGEAVYVDDIPTPSNCLHAAFVCSGKALAKIKGIKMEHAMASPGAVSFVSVQDIPSNGKNVGLISDLATEALLASDTVEFVGQPLGLLVADTLRNAKAAAGKVEVEYDTESLGPPVLTIEDAVARTSFFETSPVFKPLMLTNYGDVSEQLAKAEHKIQSAEVRTGSQYFFYMEPQTALAIPDEDNCLVVYSSCQGPHFVQASVAACLGIPMHNVRVITRRVGGGFGGKGTKACIIATTCALAAYKLQRPVRLTLDRNTDMIMMGGRNATKTVYSAGFDSDGKVKALQAQVFIQAGWSEEIGPMMPFMILKTLKKFDWGSFEFDFKVCKTNVPSRTAMRGPGDTQGSFIADTIVEHISDILSLSSHKVMERNMHTVETAEAVYGAAVVGGSEGYTLPIVWERLKEAADFEKRLKEIKHYNSSRLWKKRGLAMCQSTYGVSLLGMPGRVSILSDSSIVVEVGGVELGQGLWTKVRQTAASALSQLWGEGDGIDIATIRVVQADSISMPHGGWTGGSTTSESSCEAVRLACNVLVERLKPIKQSLQQESQHGVTWESLVSAAKIGNIDLSAQVRFMASPEASQYINYGVAASEVEVDVLTGETQLLQTDIVYDCGKSMNPAVDIGQIEGAFAQGVGFFTTEEHVVDEHGRLLSDGTWTYKPPTLDNLPRKFNVELLNSTVHKDRILSSKASGEPPLLLASSVHGAIRHAITAARKDLRKYSKADIRDSESLYFQLDSPATIDKVRTLCGLDNTELYLQSCAYGHITSGQRT